MQRLLRALLFLAIIAKPCLGFAGENWASASTSGGTVFFGLAGSGTVLEAANTGQAPDRALRVILVRPRSLVRPSSTERPAPPPIYVQPVPVVIAHPVCNRPKPLFSFPFGLGPFQKHSHSHRYYCN